MAEGLWLLRCPHCDDRFEYAPENLKPPSNLVNCPACHQDFTVKVTINVETKKLGLVSND
jgi:ssDNA-binding Zn-finger/Zn-ribbon topoisomerase 1